MPTRNPLFPIGATLHPLASEGLDAGHWYQRDLGPEIDLLAKAGCTLVRLLVSWRVLEPQVGQYDDAALERLADVVEAVRASSMRSIVCFFAEDMQSDLAQVPWSQKRDVRTDAYLVQREADLVGRVVERLQASGGVFAWQLGDESYIHGFGSAAELAVWATTLREAIREHDSKRPVIVGADAETLFRSSDFDARELIAEGELMLSHATASYRAYLVDGPMTVGAATYVEAFLLQLARGTRRIMLDEVGPVTQEHSLGEEAAALRVSLWSGLANRSSGAMLRRVTDLATERREPYFVEPFEALVGLVDTDGTPKPAYDVLANTVATIAHIDLDAYSPPPDRAAVVLPAERYAPLPSLGRLYDPRSALQAFVAAKRGHLPVTVVREDDDYAPYRALFVPSPFTLSAQTWERMAGFVQTGGSLVVSYGGGELGAHVRDLLGVDFLGDAGPLEQLACRVAQHDLLGALESFDASIECPCFALLSPTSAAVVATDATGNPLLTLNRVGQGSIVLVAAPIERALAHADQLVMPDAVSRLLTEVYVASAHMAGCDPHVGCDAPGVEVALLQGDDGDVLILVNHDPAESRTNVTLSRVVATLADVRGGEDVAVDSTTFGVTIQPSDAVALLVTYRS